MNEIKVAFWKPKLENGKFNLKRMQIEFPTWFLVILPPWPKCLPIQPPGARRPTRSPTSKL